MSNLVLRTISQGLQAFMPIAVGLAWFRAQRDKRRTAAIGLGLMLSAPATAVASWWFAHTTRRAFDEAMLASMAAAISVICLRLMPGSARPPQAAVRDVR